MEVTPCQPESERASHQNESSRDVSGQPQRFVARSSKVMSRWLQEASDLGAFALWHGRVAEQDEMRPVVLHHGHTAWTEDGDGGLADGDRRPGRFAAVGTARVNKAGPDGHSAGFGFRGGPDLLHPGRVGVRRCEVRGPVGIDCGRRQRLGRRSGLAWRCCPCGSRRRSWAVRGSPGRRRRAPREQQGGSNRGGGQGVVHRASRFTSTRRRAVTVSQVTRLQAPAPQRMSVTATRAGKSLSTANAVRAHVA